MTYEYWCEQYQREAEEAERWEQAVMPVLEELDEEGELDGMSDEEAWEYAEKILMERIERWAD